MATISVCMIVKNEEKVLKRCLDSLKGIWDELIIVDTGSTDQTKEIAAKYTDKIFDFPWVCDFAKARNFAFARAAGEYIYSADADEQLTKENWKKLVMLKQNLLPEIEIVQMWYITPKDYNTTENFEREYRPKLYKRLRSFQWMDPIHESVRLDPVVFDSDIEILHLPVNLHSKRDFDVFEKTIQTSGRLSEKLNIMYAKELMIAGEEEDFGKAGDYFDKLIQSESATSDEKELSLCILSHTFRIMGLNEKFLQCALKAVSECPCSEICLELGIYFFEKKEYGEAQNWFENAMQRTQAVLDAASQDEKPAAYLERILKAEGENEV